MAEVGPAYEREFGLRAAFRVGLHSGPVVVGEMGTIKKEIALIGDTLNTAARIVDACRDCGETFETLVMPGDAPACRACDSEMLNQQISLIATPRRGGETGMASCAAADTRCGWACEMADAYTRPYFAISA